MTWKKNRKLSYLINEFDDVDLPYEVIDEPDDQLIMRIINFFETESLLIYPAKSYFVAIVYASCLKKYFNEDFYKSLNDPDLLPDDKYFVPYDKNPHVYDKVLSIIGNIYRYESIEKTVKYFKQEMLVEDK